MSDLKILLDLLPERFYALIVIALIFLFLFKDKIPIVNKIEVKVHLPDEFMRHFRWITPLMGIIQIIILLAILSMARAICVKLGVEF